MLKSLMCTNILYCSRETLQDFLFLDFFSVKHEERSFRCEEPEPSLKPGSTPQIPAPLENFHRQQTRRQTEAADVGQELHLNNYTIMGKTMKRDRKTSGGRDAPQKYTGK